MAVANGNAVLDHVVPQGKHAPIDERVLVWEMHIANQRWLPMLEEMLLVEIVVVVARSRHDIH